MMHVRFGRRHDAITVFKICKHDVIMTQEFYALGVTALPRPSPPLTETENGLPRRPRLARCRKPGPYLLFDCDSKGRYPRAVRTLIPVETCRPNGPAAELLVPESRPAGDLHLRPRPHTEPVNSRVVRLSSLR